MGKQTGNHQVVPLGKMAEKNMEMFGNYTYSGVVQFKNDIPFLLMEITKN